MHNKRQFPFLVHPIRTPKFVHFKVESQVCRSRGYYIPLRPLDMSRELGGEVPSFAARLCAQFSSDVLQQLCHLQSRPHRVVPL
jgi:hypothetical protein